MNVEAKTKRDINPPASAERISENPLAKLDLSSMGLGITEHNKEIMSLMNKYDTNIFVIATGQGKTTGLPPMLLKEFPDARIVITQPRNAPMDKIAQHAADLVNDKVGGLIGVRYGGFDSHSDKKTRIMYEMEQSLLNEYEKDHLLTKYNIAILDEIHEPGARTQYLAPLLLMAQRERKLNNLEPLKIIATSATLDAEGLQKKFGKDTTGMLEIEGEPPFDIDKKYSDRNYKPEEMPKEAAALAKKIITDPKENKGDILIFLAGIPEIYKTKTELKNLGISEDVIDILTLHSGTSAEEKETISKKSGEKRRIILSTNAGETGVTFPKDLFHVIDTGLIKENQIDPVTGMQYLAIVEHSWSGCIQRDGRVGRQGAGKAWHLYTQENFNKRLREKKYTESEIRRTNLSPYILELLNAGIPNIRQFPFLESPQPFQMEQAMRSLQRLDAIDKQDELTEIGREMAKGHQDPHLVRMMVEGKRLNISPIIDTLADLIKNSQSVIKDQRKLGSLRVSGSDFLTLLNIYNEYLNQPDKMLWAQLVGTDQKALAEIASQHKNFDGSGIKSEEQQELIGKAIAAGFKDQILERQDNGVYKFLGNQSANGVQIDPYSPAYSKSLKYLTIGGIRKTKEGQILAQLCHGIKREWIEDILGKEPEILTPEPKIVKPIPTNLHKPATLPKPIERQTVPNTAKSLSEFRRQNVQSANKMEKRGFFRNIKSAFKSFIDFIKNLFS